MPDATPKRPTDDRFRTETANPEHAPGENKPLPAPKPATSPKDKAQRPPPRQK